MSKSADRKQGATDAPIDAITLEVVHSHLLSIADEMFVALMKSAYSTNIKERHDHSACVLDVRGRAVVLAQRSQAIHLASMQGQVLRLLETVPVETMQDGDIFISNDPYVAHATHLPDINFAAPMFVEGKLAAFCCNVAHHADVGGIAPVACRPMSTRFIRRACAFPSCG